MVFSSSKKWRNIIFTALLVVALLPALTSLSSASTEWLPGIITTVAGTGTLGYGGDGGAATSAQLRNPYGVAVDSGGNLFIADYENHRIRKVAASTGIITTVAGT
ncbi:MAG: hypothetical protein HYX91_02705, partial [Chloroflexi bacterium]|nr:hypothetical protein [Chloroflexota bacterium]